LLEIEQGVIVPLSLDRAAYPWIRNYVGKYQDLSPQWADATLCYLAEREGIDTIFTLDLRDFRVYRNRHGKPFRVIPT
jgi:predicted nucleic acid-binding protein